MLTIKVGRHTITITHPDKILFPDNGLSKLDLIEYYHSIAPLMVPYMRDRALSMVRYTDDIYHESFFQKDAPDYFPAWIKRVALPKAGGTVEYVICQNVATLVYLANQNCITPHIALSKADDRYTYPDRMIFDLDPSDNNFTLVRTMAMRFKNLLDSIQLQSFIMTTGSRGVHIIVPLDRQANFDETRMFAQELGQVLIAQDPDHLTMETRKEARGTKLFIDTLRNAYAQTGVAPYAVRAKAGAPVATPLWWHELNNPELTAQAYTIRTVKQHVEKLGDPWHKMRRLRQSVSKARALLERVTR